MRRGRSTPGRPAGEGLGTARGACSGSSGDGATADGMARLAGSWTARRQALARCVTPETGPRPSDRTLCTRLETVPGRAPGTLGGVLGAGRSAAEQVLDQG